MTGKGSRPRPLGVGRMQYDANWLRTFGPKPGAQCHDCGRREELIAWGPVGHLCVDCFTAPDTEEGP